MEYADPTIADLDEAAPGTGLWRRGPFGSESKKITKQQSGTWRDERTGVDLASLEDLRLDNCALVPPNATS